MILDILDVQFVGGDADDGPYAAGEPTEVRAPGSMGVKGGRV